MSKDLEFADRHHLRLIIEHVKALVEAFSHIESSKEGRSASEAEALDMLNIDGLTQKQILRAVAEKRLEQYPTRGEAAKSLGIDIRTLKKHLDYQEAND